VGSLILDPSVLIGLLDDADAHHQRAVDDVEAADEASRELVAPATA
jgi:predicted nucleic acid-binding protein